MSAIETFFTADEEYNDYDTSLKESTFGGPESLWGATEITKADLLAPEFKVSFDAIDISGIRFGVDAVTIEVFYRAAAFGTDPDVSVPPYAPAPWAASAIGPHPSGQGRRIILVGLGGRISYSDDLGDTWTEVTPLVSDILRCATYVGGEFIAAGDNGVILTSSDGATWTASLLTGGNRVYAIARDRGANRAAVGGRSGALQRLVDGEWLASSEGVR